MARKCARNVLSEMSARKILSHAIARTEFISEKITLMTSNTCMMIMARNCKIVIYDLEYKVSEYEALDL